MSFIKTCFSLFISAAVLTPAVVSTSSAAGDAQYKDIKKTTLDSEKDRERIQKAAVLLARYEIEAKKLLDMLEHTDSHGISGQAGILLTLSEEIIESARFRLPECDDYLAQSVALKDRLGEISHAELESGYHMDGALPKAPPGCYHTKDLFVHPATVMVLVRDDAGMEARTRSSIRAEIEEVLAHTEVVRQLVIF